MATIPESERAKSVVNLELEQLPTESALGLKWNIEDDKFVWDVMEKILQRVSQKLVTRRGIGKLTSEIILYADNTVIYYSLTDMLDLESKLNSDLATISNWFSSNLLTLNISKCNFVIFGNSRRLKLVNDVSLSKFHCY